MKNPILKINNFSFRYPYSKGTINLHGEIEIRKGETVLVSGPSGSGKSTLLYAIKGLIPNTIFGKLLGNVLFRGKQSSELTTEEQLQIGFLFQNPDAQMINRTVKQELALGMENLKTTSTVMNSKIERYAKDFEITNLLEREIHHLSGGEKQKVALVSILLMDPDVILFDEPTAFLDPVSAKNYIDTFKKIASTKTIIIIEHNRNYLKNFVNRVISVDNTGNMKELNLSKITWQKKFTKLEKVEIGSSIIKVDQLRFSYTSNRNLLNNIKIELHKGEIISIIGKNGSGKSTLMKLIAQQLKPDSGKISYHKDDNTNILTTNRKKHIALLLQNPENHFLFNSVEKEIVSQDVMDKTRLSGLEKRNPFTLSEGEKRRLSLGILWSLDREIYLLDEPTFGQDEENVVGLIKMIDLMRKNGKAFIVTSHDSAFVEAISDKILKLENGNLQEITNEI